MERVVLAACFYTLCLFEGPTPAAPVDRWGVTVEHGRSFVVGPDGKRHMLMRAVDAGPSVHLPTVDRTLPRPMTPLPSTVDLSADQTPVPDQGGRDTCTVFSFTAAVEAAYKRRYGTTLDLSEQYFNHVMQMNRGVSPARPIPYNETNAGSAGGGGIDINAFYMTRGELALPPEIALPYIGDGVYQEHDAAGGDVPDLMDYAVLYHQRDVDDFNLSDVAQDYRFPFALRTTVLPQAALDGAVYRATGVVAASGSDLADVDWYRTQLAGGHEVVIEINCCEGNPGLKTMAPWNLPPGSNGGGATHALLLVGYDDASRTFLVKNSWGTAWANGGYVRMSYDFVTVATRIAISITDIADPTQGAAVANNHALVLGRWNLDIDGTPAILDVYGLPRVADDGVHLNRLGTLFRSDGSILRINGEETGNAIDFWIDQNQPDPPLGQTTGVHFHGYVFDHDHRSMAGTFSDASGALSPFEAIKGSNPISGVSAGPILNGGSAVGSWKLNQDGLQGVLNIDSVNPASGAVSGTYADSRGTLLSISGTVEQDNRHITFAIPFAASPQTFDGILNHGQLGVMAGETTAQGTRVGFFATRTGPPDRTGQACLAQCTRDRNQCLANAHSGAARGVCLQAYNDCRTACSTP